jgi:hypothetical protein
METRSVEKKLPSKQRLKELRERAITERDYLRLQEYNLKIKKVKRHSLRYCSLSFYQCL